MRTMSSDNRERARAKPRVSHAAVEKRVASRTAVLKRMIRSLQVEHEERLRAEQELLAANAALARRTGQLQALAVELTRAEQRERRRFAQLLHDHLQQLLVGARHKLEILRAEGRNPVADRTAEQIDELLEQCLDQARLLTVELSPPVVHCQGLAGGLQWLGKQMRERHGLVVAVEGDHAAEPADTSIRMLLFQAVRELLLNVVKHAGVDRARITMSNTAGGEVRIEVGDAGAGFDPRQAETALAAEGGFGLFSIRERLEFLGGRMEIDSAPGKGTRAVISIPLNQSMQRGPTTPPPGDGFL